MWHMHYLSVAPSKLRFLAFLPHVTNNIIYLSEKCLKKGPFSVKTLYEGRKYFKIFGRVFLWAIVISDTPFRATRHSLHRFSNSLQTSYKWL